MALFLVGCFAAITRASENVDIRERAELVRYMKEVASSKDSFDAQYDNLQVGTLLSARNLTTKSGIQNSRARLQTLRDLIRERNEELQIQIQTLQKKLKNLRNQKKRLAWSSEIQKVTEWMIFTSTTLSSIQLEGANALEDVFNWAERNQDNIRDNHGRLDFATAKLRRECETLLHRLSDLASDEAAAVAKMRAKTGPASTPSAMKQGSAGRRLPASLAVAPIPTSAFQIQFPPKE